MISARSERHAQSQPRGPVSTRWLATAVATSLVVVVSGSLLMWSLFRGERPAGPTGTSERKHEGASSADRPLVVAIARTPGGPSEWRGYALALSEVQEQLGRPLRVRYVTSRSAALELFRKDDVDAAFVSTYRYIELDRSGEVTLVATPIIDGRSGDAAVMVVAQDSPFHTLDDLRGGAVLLSSPMSLGGHTYLYWLMESKGTTPERYFSSVESTGSQDVNLRRVHEGAADAACVNRSGLSSWPEGEFRIISTSPEYGMPPLVARTSLDAATVSALRQAIASSVVRAALPRRGALDGFSGEVGADAYWFAELLFNYAQRLDTDS